MEAIKRFASSLDDRIQTQAREQARVLAARELAKKQKESGEESSSSSRSQNTPTVGLLGGDYAPPVGLGGGGDYEPAAQPATQRESFAAQAPSLEELQILVSSLVDEVERVRRVAQSADESANHALAAATGRQAKETATTQNVASGVEGPPLIDVGNTAPQTMVSIAENTDNVGQRLSAVEMAATSTESKVTLVAEKLVSTMQRLVALEANKATAPSIPDEVSRRLSALEAATAANKATAPSIPDEVSQRLSALEAATPSIPEDVVQRLIALETAAASAAEATDTPSFATVLPDDVEKRLSAVEAAAAGTAGAPLAASALLKTLGERISAIEGKREESNTASQPDLEARIGELEARVVQSMDDRVAKLDARVSTSMSELEARTMQLSESMLASRVEAARADIEGKVDAQVDAVVDAVFSERMETPSTSIGELEARVSQKTDDRVAALVDSVSTSIETARAEIEGRVGAQVDAAFSERMESLSTSMNDRVAGLSTSIGELEVRMVQSIDDRVAKLDDRVSTSISELEHASESMLTARIEVTRGEMEARLLQLCESRIESSRQDIVATSEAKISEAALSSQHSMETAMNTRISDLMARMLESVESHIETAVQDRVDALEGRLRKASAGLSDLSDSVEARIQRMKELEQSVWESLMIMQNQGSQSEKSS